MERPDKLSVTLRRTAAGMALAALGVAMPAQAQSASALAMPAMTAAFANAACQVVNTPVIAGIGDEAAAAGAISKASAILGGNGSALERIRAQQASFASLGPLIPQAGPLAVPVEEISFEPLAPASAAFASAKPCNSDFGPVGTRLVQLDRATLPAGLSRDDFLSSRKVALGRTSFDSSWARVSREKPRSGLLPRILPQSDTGLDTKLDAINSWVNHAITYTEDRQLFGKADYWAGPRKTLQLGKGDCEDYAILKMHLLAAAGVRREDMFLTIARDLVRRADHAVLIVRTPTGYRMLDNATDRVLDATLANDYQAVLSFNDRRTWLHGT